MKNLFRAISDLFPGYFALVMATGIVSIACHLFGLTLLSSSFFYINVIAYGVLVLLNIIRLLFYPSRLWDDLTSHAKGPAFFTAVAGTNILGVQFCLLCSNYSMAFSLLLIASLLWLILTYTFFSAVMIKETKPDFASGVNGAWLTIIVGTQSISVLSTYLAPYFANALQGMLFISLCMYLAGCMLYFLVTLIIFYRLIFFQIEPKMLTPPFWILMGAAAITTLAGSLLLLSADKWVFIVSITPFLKGFTLFFWAIATWWIPLLLVLGGWRHLYKRVAFAYNPQYWSMVFPLGMYTSCTFRLSKALALPFLMLIPRFFLIIAITAWSITFCSMIYEIVRGLFKNPAEQASPIP